MDIRQSNPEGRVPRRLSPDYARISERANEIRQSEGKTMSTALAQAFKEAQRPPPAVKPSSPVDVDDLLAVRRDRYFAMSAADCDWAQVASYRQRFAGC